jgi:DeoR/GlpR family transcriptional regulator of sugar metabolism
MVSRQGSISVEQIGEEFGVSSMTVWRDLRAIELQANIRRVRGGAVVTGHDDLEPKFAAKRLVNASQKRSIAKYAADQFVQDGMILLLEGGTTIACMVPFLKQSGLTILTNGLNILVEASKRVPGLTVMSCGGLLRDTSHTFVGPEAQKFFANYRADICFLSATGLTHDDGITDPNPLEIEVKRTMAARARRRILLLDSDKFAVHSLANVMPLDEINVLVTDSKAPEPTLIWLRRHGIEVHVAP